MIGKSVFPEVCDSARSGLGAWGGIGAAIAGGYRQILFPERDDEIRACLKFGEALGGIESVRDRPDPETRTRPRLVHALLNRTDFVTVR